MVSKRPALLEDGSVDEGDWTKLMAIGREAAVFTATGAFAAALGAAAGTAAAALGRDDEDEAPVAFAAAGF